MTVTTQSDAPIARTRIPYGRHVEGLEYGSHVGLGTLGYGYHVRVGDGPWVRAVTTPAADELPGDGTDADIVEAIREEAAQLARGDGE